MPNQGLLTGLIATYRTLNVNVRPLPEDRLRVASDKGGNGSVRDVVLRLRDSELRFSQALKERISGVPMSAALSDETPVIGTEHDDDDTVSVLAQFGTARESTLAMLRDLPDQKWDEGLEGGQTIRDRIEQLLENDRAQLERINALLGAPSPA
ncbi:MAG TPA: hypothetical protein VGR16_10190 [Thermomicrobiales bacterium]|nr:hypothetical protein [Thermomicrobiales bacterium]